MRAINESTPTTKPNTQCPLLPTNTTCNLRPCGIDEDTQVLRSNIHINTNHRNPSMATKPIPPSLWRNSPIPTCHLSQKQGYIPEIYQQTKTKSIRENFLSQPAKKAQIPITYTPDITLILSTALQKKIPPLILLNLRPIIGENVYHWVVVTGKDTHYIFVNDPYIPKHQKITEKKDVPITHNAFHQALNSPQTGIFHIPSAAILIHK